MKKHAYLIMAHNEFHMLKKLITELDDERNDIFIHIDKKTKYVDENEISSWATKSKIVFIPRRAIYWGHFSIVECELDLLREATKGAYHYYHLISGVDFPLKSQEVIHEFFDGEDSEFIDYHTDGENGDHFLYKVKYYFPLFKLVGKGRFDGPGKKQAILRELAGFQQKLVDFQEKCGVDRTKSYKDETIYKGSQWFSITHDFAEYIIESEKLIKKRYRMTNAPDELFITNLAMNSPFADRVKKNDLREIDWLRGGPYEFTIDDLDMLKTSENFFARKISYDRNPELVEGLTQHLHPMAQTKDDPLISVVVPCYNVEKYINECVDSLVAQSYGNLEILLIDDGATDKTADIARDYASKYDNIHYHHRENGGLSAARNTGIEHAKGEYIAFVDSDDWVEPDYIEKLYSAISRTHAEISVCGFRKEEMEDKVVIFDNNKVISAHEAMEILGDIYPKENVLLVIAWNKLYNMQLFNNVRFPEGRIHEDEFTSHRIISGADSIATVAEPLYHYRIREGSITASDKSQDLRHRDLLDALVDRVHCTEKMYFGDLMIVMLYSCYEGIKHIMYTFSKETIKKNAVYTYLRKKMLPVYFGYFSSMDSYLRRYGMKFFLFPDKCRTEEIIHRDGKLSAK